MTRLDEIRERCKRLKTHIHLRQPSMRSACADIDYLCGLLESHPASEPPIDDRWVIVQWGERTSLGQYIQGAWYVQGWVVVTDYHCPVESWQELPPGEQS